MKVAGVKNDGAWFRMNVFIKNLGTFGKDALQAQIEQNPDFQAMFEAATQIGNTAGYAEPPSSLADYSSWAHQLVHVGIPRQVWLGTLTWDTYVNGGPEFDRKVPEHAEVWRKGASALRKICTRFRLARRQLLDFANEVGADEGNPGGVADADLTL